MKRLYIRKAAITGEIPAGSYLNGLAVVKAIRAMGGVNFTEPVTIFVGENGTGKSTLIEAIATSMRFNPEGGTVNFRFSTEDTHSELYKYIRLTKGANAPKKGFFFRAESFYNVATYLDSLFEGEEMPVPKEVEKVLSLGYGDFMKLPPEDQRKVHHDYILMDPNNSFRIYKGTQYCKEKQK